MSCHCTGKQPLSVERVAPELNCLKKDSHENTKEKPFLFIGLLITAGCSQVEPEPGPPEDVMNQRKLLFFWEVGSTRVWKLLAVNGEAPDPDCNQEVTKITFTEEIWT